MPGNAEMNPAETAAVPLIGLAHGSRHSDVAIWLDDLMVAAQQRLGVPCRACYLDLTDPSLDTVAAALAGQGHRQAVVLPLLFTSAFHANVDVPRTIDEAATSAGLQLVTAEILGTGEPVLSVLLEALATAGVPVASPLLLVAVGSSDAAANRAVERLAADLGRVRSVSCLIGYGTREPRAVDLIATLPRSAAVVPLFVAPGLLLDPVVAAAGGRGLQVLPPLGRLLVGVVEQRYREAVAALSGSGSPAPRIVSEHG